MNGATFDGGYAFLPGIFAPKGRVNFASFGIPLLNEIELG
jgi:hypothetical protein